jgi:hypothetical protein
MIGGISMTRITLGIVASLSLAAAFPVAAQAQNGSLTRSFVSSSGVDTSACTITQPCATFAQAYTKVGANGIVAALDPGKYGPLTISGPVTINGNGWAAITGPSGSSAITVNAGSGSVTLTGLEIDGAGTSSSGIVFNSGGSLNVRDSLIQNSGGDGITIAASVTSGLLVVSNTSVSNNGGNGIRFLSAAVTSVLSRVETNGNVGSGISAPNPELPLGSITITDSVSADNGADGYGCSGTIAEFTLMWVIRSTVVGNSGAGLNGAGCWIMVRGSMLQRNASGNFAGITLSFGDNAAPGDGTAPSSNIPLQ